MSHWRGFRWSAGWLFLPLIMLAAYAGAVSEREFFGDYPLVAISQAWVSLVVVGPLLAGWTAWDSARLRPWLDATFAGAHCGKALLRVLGPAVALAAVVVVSAVVLVAGRPQGVSAWTVMVAGVLTMVAAATFGAAVGAVASRLVAVPVAVAATYGALALAVADPSSWPGRVTVTGVVAPCCSPTQQVSVPGLAVVGTVALLVIGGGLLTVVMPAARLVRAVILAGSIAVAVATSWCGAQQIGPYGQIAARTTAPVCRKTTDAQVCVWPEHAPDLPRIEETIGLGRRAAGSVGLDLPTRWNESPKGGADEFMWSSDLTVNQHRYAFGIDIAHWAGCTDPDDEALVASVLALQMGVLPAELPQRDPSAVELADQLSRLAEPVRRHQVLERIETCRS